MPSLFIRIFRYNKIKVMIKLVAGYRTITPEGRKLESANPAKLKFELTGQYRAQTVYQDINCNLYTYRELVGQQITFTDNSNMKVQELDGL